MGLPQKEGATWSKGNKEQEQSLEQTDTSLSLKHELCTLQCLLQGERETWQSCDWEGWFSVVLCNAGIPLSMDST